MRQEKFNEKEEYYKKKHRNRSTNELILALAGSRIRTPELCAINTILYEREIDGYGFDVPGYDNFNYEPHCMEF